MSTSTAVRKGGGSLMQQCFDLQEEAAAAIKSASPTAPAAYTTSATEQAEWACQSNPRVSSAVRCW